MRNMSQSDWDICTCQNISVGVSKIIIIIIIIIKIKIKIKNSWIRVFNIVNSVALQ